MSRFKCPNCGESYTVWYRNGTRYERCLDCGYRNKEDE